MEKMTIFILFEDKESLFVLKLMYLNIRFENRIGGFI
jgi:hypothetical protein